MEFVGALENLVQKLLKVEQTCLRAFQKKKNLVLNINHKWYIADTQFQWG